MTIKDIYLNAILQRLTFMFLRLEEMNKMN